MCLTVQTGLSSRGWEELTFIDLLSARAGDFNPFLNLICPIPFRFNVQSEPAGASTVLVLAQGSSRTPASLPVWTVGVNSSLRKPRLREARVTQPAGHRACTPSWVSHCRTHPLPRLGANSWARGPCFSPSSRMLTQRALPRCPSPGGPVLRPGSSAPGTARICLPPSLPSGAPQDPSLPGCCHSRSRGLLVGLTTPRAPRWARAPGLCAESAGRAWTGCGVAAGDEEEGAVGWSFLPVCLRPRVGNVCGFRPR